MKCNEIVECPGAVPLIIGLYERRKEVIYPTTLSCYISNYSRLKEILNELKELGIVNLEREDENTKNWNVSLTLKGKKVARVFVRTIKTLDELLEESE